MTEHPVFPSKLLRAEHLGFKVNKRICGLSGRLNTLYSRYLVVSLSFWIPTNIPISRYFQVISNNFEFPAFQL